MGKKRKNAPDYHDHRWDFNPVTGAWKCRAPRCTAATSVFALRFGSPLLMVPVRCVGRYEVTNG
ncbi:MAG: hypothetical protein ACYS5V_10025 [Planctomycetota bacterium]